MKATAGKVISLAERRQRFFATGFRSMQECPPQSITDEATLDFVLPKAGIALGAYVTIEAVIANVAGGAGGTKSQLGMATWLKNLSLVDAAGVTRINASGDGLRSLQEVSGFGYDEDASSDTSVYDFACPAADGSEAWKMQIYVPFSVGKFNSLGAIPLALPMGQTRMSMKFNKLAAVNSIISPIDATDDATDFSITSATAYVTVLYIEPKAGEALPVEDFQFCREIVTVTDNSNLSPSTEKRIVLPTGRTYSRAITTLLDAASAPMIPVETIDRVGLLLNGATPVFDIYYKTYVGIQSKGQGQRLSAGHVLFDMSKRAYSPNDFGEVALKLNLSSGFNGAVAKCDVTYDSLYRMAGKGIS